MKRVEARYNVKEGRDTYCKGKIIHFHRSEASTDYISDDTYDIRYEVFEENVEAGLIRPLQIVSDDSGAWAYDRAGRSAVRRYSFGRSRARSRQAS